MSPADRTFRELVADLWAAVPDLEPEDRDEYLDLIPEGYVGPMLDGEDWRGSVHLTVRFPDGRVEDVTYVPAYSSPGHIDDRGPQLWTLGVGYDDQEQMIDLLGGWV